MVSEGSAGVEQKRLGRPTRVEKIGDLAVAVLDVIEAMAAFVGVGPHLGGGLEIAGIDADEENVPLRKLDPQVADQVVVVAGIGTDHGEEQDDDAAAGIARALERSTH